MENHITENKKFLDAEICIILKTKEECKCDELQLCSIITSYWQNIRELVQWSPNETKESLARLFLSQNKEKILKIINE